MQNTQISMRSLLVLAFIMLASASCTDFKPSVVYLDFNTLEEPETTSPDLRTIRSIKKINNFYTVEYFGDYEERLEWLSEHHKTLASEVSRPRSCSLYAATNTFGHPIFGRNFDRENDTAVLSSFSPSGKYRSFAFSPFSEVYMEKVVNAENPAESDVSAFLTCLPFYATDGINEKGLAIGLAGAPLRRVDRSETREPMFVLHFIREALDTCANLDEVSNLVQRVDLYDKSISEISHHIMAVDSSGRWMIIDYPNGVLRIKVGSEEFACRTNHFLEGGPAIPGAQDSFVRFERICRRLESVENMGDSLEFMELLRRVANDTVWSVVYEPQSASAVLAAGEKYKRLFRFGFHNTEAGTLTIGSPGLIEVLAQTATGPTPPCVRVRTGRFRSDTGF